MTRRIACVMTGRYFLVFSNDILNTLTAGFVGTKLTKGEHIIYGGDLPMIFQYPPAGRKNILAVDRVSVRCYTYNCVKNNFVHLLSPMRPNVRVSQDMSTRPFTLRSICRMFQM
jgi:hypothetical protein